MLSDPGGLTAYTYNQTTGEFYGGNIYAVGYSGHGAGLNNPAAQDQANVGPIPTGTYTLSGAYSSSTGRPTFDTMPSSDTRGGFPEDRNPDSFRIHADNSDHDFSASEGCIILDPSVRSQLEAGDTVTVISGEGLNQSIPPTDTEAQQLGIDEAANLLNATAPISTYDFDGNNPDLTFPQTGLLDDGAEGSSLFTNSIDMNDPNGPPNEDWIWFRENNPLSFEVTCAIYLPLAWAADHCEPLGRAFHWYAHLYEP